MATIIDDTEDKLTDLENFQDGSNPKGFLSNIDFKNLGMQGLDYAEQALETMPNLYEDLDPRRSLTNAIYGDSTESPISRLLDRKANMNSAESEIYNNTVNFGNVNNNQNLQNAWKNSSLQNGINYNFGWRNIGDAGKDAAKGFMKGFKSTGDPISGAIVGGAYLLGNIGAQLGGKSRAQQLNADIKNANNAQINSMTNQINNIKQDSAHRDMYNIFAKGGNLLDGLQSNGVNVVNEGGSHEQNPLGGVPMGVDSQGTPNQVEQGEVVYKDMVYTDRYKLSGTASKHNNLNKKYYGLTPAKAMEKAQQESKERPNDPISISTLDEVAKQIFDAQEEDKQRREQSRILRMIDKMSPEEKMQMLAMAQQQMQEQMNAQQASQDPYMQQGMEQGVEPQMSPDEQAMMEQQAMQEQMPQEQVQQPMFAKGGRLFAIGGAKPDIPPDVLLYDPSYTSGNDLSLKTDINGNSPRLVYNYNYDEYPSKKETPEIYRNPETLANELISSQYQNTGNFTPTITYSPLKSDQFTSWSKKATGADWAASGDPAFQAALKLNPNLINETDERKIAAALESTKEFNDFNTLLGKGKDADTDTAENENNRLHYLTDFVIPQNDPKAVKHAMQFIQKNSETGDWEWRPDMRHLYEDIFGEKRHDGMARSMYRTPEYTLRSLPNATYGFS